MRLRLSRCQRVLHQGGRPLGSPRVSALGFRGPAELGVAGADGRTRSHRPHAASPGELALSCHTGPTPRICDVWRL